jgi:hypothetical protein
MFNEDYLLSFSKKDLKTFLDNNKALIVSTYDKINKIIKHKKPKVRRKYSEAQKKINKIIRVQKKINDIIKSKISETSTKYESLKLTKFYRDIYSVRLDYVSNYPMKKFKGEIYNYECHQDNVEANSSTLDAITSAVHKTYNKIQIQSRNRFLQGHESVLKVVFRIDKPDGTVDLISCFIRHDFSYENI